MITAGKARAFWTLGGGRGRVIEEDLLSIGRGEVLVEAIASGVSRGSELLVFTGRVPPSQYQTMRAPHQQGDFPAPVKYGYANVGRVIAGSDALHGKVVFCLYPHQDRYVVPEDAVVPVPDDVPAGRAVLAANMETAVNALWDAAPRVGDRITVIGAGVVGCLVAALAAVCRGPRWSWWTSIPPRLRLRQGFRCRSACPMMRAVSGIWSSTPAAAATALSMRWPLPGSRPRWWS